MLTNGYSGPENPIALHPSSLHVATKFNVAPVPQDLPEMSDANNPNLADAFLEQHFGGYEAEFERAARHCDMLADPSLLELRTALLQGPGLPGMLVVGSRGTGRSCMALTLAGRLFRGPIKAFVGYLPCTRLSTHQPTRGRGETPCETVARIAWGCVRHAPAVLVIDDLDVLAPSSAAGQTDDEQAVVDSQAAQAIAELLGCLASVYSRTPVAVVATAQSLQSLHPLLRVPAAFAETIELCAPSTDARASMIKGLAAKKRTELAPEVCTKLARATEGFVAADLATVVERAVHSSIARGAETISAEDADAALDGFVPLGLMGTRTLPPPDVRWEDVGGLVDVKKALKETLEWPSKFPHLFSSCPIRLHSGILLYGPPGCGE